MKACALIPIYDHGAAVEAVVDELAASGLPCLVVDDGSGEATRRALDRVAERHPFVERIRHERNRGKGAALKTGFRAARERGFSHVVHLDADGQHRAADVPRFVDAMREQPSALVLGVPVFDASAPRARIAARQISRALVWLACLSRAIRDPLCGFRGVPLAAALEVIDAVRTGDRMDFEPELAVRLVWRGTPVRSLPTPVTYPPQGVSHFRLARDYPLLAGLYVRLVAGMLLRAPELLRARALEIGA